MIRFIESARWTDLGRRQRFSKVYTLAVPAWRRPVVEVEATITDEGISRDEIEALFSDVLARHNGACRLSSQDRRQLRQDTRLRAALTV
ncbi:hypothetical protein [Aliiroseovarius sp. 2305UL8-7]|uniref:hypothetical protein n=1 Tax=Aliiroseovarius conchicola TaxID=3121637 RepID=UPI0035298893